MTTMTVVQCWDDGVNADLGVLEICRRHDAMATFNLNAGLHEPARKKSWVYKDTDVWRLGWDEMLEAYDGFAIANHSLTHPRLEQIPIEQAREEIRVGRERLQAFFQDEIRGFAYPFGSYSPEVMEVIRDCGHAYARTVKNVAQAMPPEDPMAFHPNCHFLAADFWERYEAARACGVFYFWGHSYEMVTDEMWATFDAQIARISADPTTRWANVQDLFPAGDS